MAALTPEQERILTKMKATAVKAKFLPDDVAASMAARTTEMLGFDAQGEPFKAGEMLDIFADMDDDSLEDAQESMAANVIHPLGLNPQGQPFKPQEGVGSFVDLDTKELTEEKPLRQAS